MRKLLIIAMFAALSAQAQQVLHYPSIWATDTTNTAGTSKFEWTGQITFHIRDSVRYEPNAPVFVPGYISLQYSTMGVEITKRIIRTVKMPGVSAVTDTSYKTKYLQIPLMEVGNKYADLINSVAFRRALKSASKDWSTKKWNQE